MDIKEMEQKKQLVLSKCVCNTCPSWDECGEVGGFCFPTIGKSKCITEENGCICVGCPIYNMMDLKNTYYCTKGSEKEQSYQ